MKLNLKKGFVKDGFRWFTTRWNTPAKGNYVSFKEIAAYSIGGMGVQFIAAVVNSIAMSAGCLLIGSVYGLTPTEMQIIAVVGVLVSLLIVPVRGMLMDNTKSKKGKYRPIILWASIPTALIAVAMAFIPLTASHMTKVAIIGVGFTLINIFYNQLLFLAYSNLVQVISPNSNERATIVSISSIVYSMAPTLTGLLMPIIAEVSGGSMIDIAVYRLMFPIFGAIGVLISFFAYFGTKERVVQKQTKTAAEKIPFKEGLKSALSNKYLWLYNIQQMLLFARNASVLILNWIFVYQLQNGYLMGLLTTLMGTASFIGMVTAPILVRFIGKRNLNILQNLVYGIAYGLTFFSSGNFWIMFVLIYIGNVANSTSIITNPTMNADILDYEQCRTGKRMDGFFGNIGIVTAVVGMATGFIIPQVTEAYGLLTNYDVLYDSVFRSNIIKILAIISFSGGILCCIPMLFYDLTEKKLRVMMCDLKKRTLAADLEAGNITQEEYDEKVKEIDEQEAIDSAKQAKIDAKKEKRRAKLKGAKKADTTPTAETEKDEVVEVEIDGGADTTAVPTIDALQDEAKVIGEFEATGVIDNDIEKTTDSEGGEQ